jgi:hypothetical protein
MDEWRVARKHSSQNFRRQTSFNAFENSLEFTQNFGTATRNSAVDDRLPLSVFDHRPVSPRIGETGAILPVEN